MIRSLRLLRNERGTGLIEFALVLPVLITFIYGTFVMGQLMEANAGMQQALGEGARYATLCLSPSPTMGCTVPSNTQIQAKMNAAVFRAGLGSFGTPAVADGPAGSNYKTLSVSYTVPMNFIFFRVPSVTLNQSKRVYTA